MFNCCGLPEIRSWLRHRTCVNRHLTRTAQKADFSTLTFSFYGELIILHTAQHKSAISKVSIPRRSLTMPDGNGL